MSSDNFYNDGSDGPDQWKKMGVLAVEMEAAGLYMTAARAGKRALCLCTISDHMYRTEELTPAERESTMNEMIEISPRHRRGHGLIPFTIRQQKLYTKKKRNLLEPYDNWCYNHHAALCGK